MVLKIRRLRTGIALVTLIPLVLLSNCSFKIRKKQPASTVYTSKELSVTPNQIRLRMRSLVEPFTGEIEQSADVIAAGTTDIPLKRAAIRWKIEGVPALRNALFEPHPFTAVLDTWVLLYQMANYFGTGPGRNEFGPAADRARDTCLRLETELNQIVSTFTVSRDVTKVREGAKQWAMEHPIRYAIRDRETALGRVTEQDLGVAWTAGEVIAELATTADDVHREIQIYSDHLFRQARWEAELLKLDLPTTELFTLAERAVKSSERAVDTLDDLTPTIKTAANATASAAEAATKLTAEVPTLAASERKAAVDAISADLRTTLEFLHSERTASIEQLSDQITDERIAILQQLEKERLIAIEDIHKIATNERVAFTQDLEQAGLRIVDHAAWRLLQLVAVILGFLFLAALLFLFIVRRLFFSARPSISWIEGKVA